MSANRVPEPEPEIADSQLLSLQAIYAENFAFVWRNLRRLGVRDEALRDAAQDVFLVVHRRLSTFESHGAIRGWLYSIVRKVAADHRRRRARKDPQDVVPAEDVADARDAGPEQAAMRSQALQLLLHLLAELDEVKREVLILADLEGMTVPEIAAALDCNQNTVYSRLRDARQTMRQRFERHTAASRRAR